MEKNLLLSCAVAVFLIFASGTAVAQKGPYPCNFSPDTFARLVKLAQTAVNRQKSPWEVDPSSCGAMVHIGGLYGRYETIHFLPKGQKELNRKRVVFSAARDKFSLRVATVGVYDKNVSIAAYCIQKGEFVPC